MSFLSKVGGPTAAKGVIIRRRRVLAIADTFEFDRRAVKAMQHLRRRYGRGPLMLRIPMRRQAVVLHHDDVRRVLDQTPDPFATASLEKRGALSHFEPKGALISHGANRAVRREFNEEVLQHERQMHEFARNFVATVDREAKQMLSELPRRAVLDWDHFAQYWFRTVRQVIFGSEARDDHTLREMIDTLRARGNWSYLGPKRRRLREQFLARIRHHLARAEEGSLAQIIARMHTTEQTATEHQIPQWLFAFDPAGMTLFRALALLASHPEQYQRARDEVSNTDAMQHPLPLLRAAALEALRLWPTTPLVLRETVRDVEWDTGIIPARTGIIIFAPYFHRDDENLPYAHRFVPEVWTDDHHIRDRGHEMGPEDWPLVPFSRGSGICPGRNVVLLTVSAFLATILHTRQVRLLRPRRLDPERPLPGTLNHFSLRFELD